MSARIKAVIYFVLVISGMPAWGQQLFHAVVTDRKDRKPLTGVVVSDGHGHGAVSDDSGHVMVSVPAAGVCSFYFNYTGYNKDSITVTLPDSKVYTVAMAQSEDALEEVIVVAATRTNDRIENAPTKVEVLGSEDLGEENTIRPANIASILGDVSGVQLQQSSATSGNTNVRIQGLNGQYTQILRDGMPLYDGLSGGFGVLQVAPLDLKQVELIKGSASTLYGGGAIGGLINLVSKKPGEQQEGIFTMNATTLNEQNLNAYVAKRYKKFGYTLFAGYTQQAATDVNGDGFSDVPQLNTFMVHPRLFFYPDEKTTLTVGYNGTFEKRVGGDIQAINNLPDSLHQYIERNNTQRNTGELIFERSLPGLMKLTIKGSISNFARDIITSYNDIKAAQLSYYGEASLFIPQQKNSIVTGINVTGNNFRTLPGSENIPLSLFSDGATGAFAQYTWRLQPHTTIEGGLRADHTISYGNFILPRITAIHRFGEAWAIRAGAGMGYKTPNPFEVQVIDYTLDQLQPLQAGIKAERSTGYNLEGNYRKDFNNHINLFINHAFFLTNITDPVVATETSMGSVYFNNASKPVSTKGTDTYIKLTIGTIELYAGYTYTDAERTYLAANQFMPLTPRNGAAFTAVKTIEDKWRFGLEGSYVGNQYRDGDTRTPAYFMAAAMIERKFGKMYSVVLNGENLLNYRQTKYETIYTGSRISPVFKPLWAPIDGRVINLSVRIMPFAKK